MLKYLVPILFAFSATASSAFENNFTMKAYSKLVNRHLIEDLLVGDSARVSKYHFCVLKDKIYVLNFVIFPDIGNFIITKKPGGVFSVKFSPIRYGDPVKLGEDLYAENFALHFSSKCREDSPIADYQFWPILDVNGFSNVMDFYAWVYKNYKVDLD
ncbi:MAG: hypothetical protein ACON5C_09370 [Alphaproteobacteria bacterium]